MDFTLNSSDVYKVHNRIARLNSLVISRRSRISCISNYLNKSKIFYKIYVYTMYL